jgi:hypothetical protein
MDQAGYTSQIAHYATSSSNARRWAAAVADRRVESDYSFFSIFQKIGVAGPSRTPESDVRHALGMRYWPRGI